MGEKEKERKKEKLKQIGLSNIFPVKTISCTFTSDKQRKQITAEYWH
jgi:hypothetical protein